MAEKILKIYAFCPRCNGTGKIYLTNGPLPPTEISCSECEGTGKILFGEVKD